MEHSTRRTQLAAALIMAGAAWAASRKLKGTATAASDARLARIEASLAELHTGQVEVRQAAVAQIARLLPHREPMGRKQRIPLRVLLVVIFCGSIAILVLSARNSASESQLISEASSAENTANAIRLEGLIDAQTGSIASVQESTSSISTDSLKAAGLNLAVGTAKTALNDSKIADKLDIEADGDYQLAFHDQTFSTVALAASSAIVGVIISSFVAWAVDDTRRKREQLAFVKALTEVGYGQGSSEPA